MGGWYVERQDNGPVGVGGKQGPRVVAEGDPQGGLGHVAVRGASVEEVQGSCCRLVHYGACRSKAPVSQNFLPNLVVPPGTLVFI